MLSFSNPLTRRQYQREHPSSKSCQRWWQEPDPADQHLRWSTTDAFLPTPEYRLRKEEGHQANSSTLHHGRKVTNLNTTDNFSMNFLESWFLDQQMVPPFHQLRTFENREIERSSEMRVVKWTDIAATASAGHLLTKHFLVCPTKMVRQNLFQEDPGTKEGGISHGLLRSSQKRSCDHQHINRSIDAFSYLLAHLTLPVESAISSKTAICRFNSFKASWRLSKMPKGGAALYMHP